MMILVISFTYIRLQQKSSWADKEIIVKLLAANALWVLNKNSLVVVHFSFYLADSLFLVVLIKLEKYEYIFSKM